MCVCVCVCVCAEKTYFRMVQWLRIFASTAGGTGLTPGWGTKVLMQLCSQKRKIKKRKENCSKHRHVLEVLELILDLHKTKEIKLMHIFKTDIF